MLTKSDLILILSNMPSNPEINTYIAKTAKNDTIQYDVLRYINTNRQLDVANFYDMLRKKHNNKKSKLYKNLVKEEFDNPNEVLITLAALNLQILLFAKNLGDNQMFLKHSRGDEISEVLNKYYKSYDLIPCLKLLRLIRADIKAFECIK